MIFAQKLRISMLKRKNTILIKKKACIPTRKWNRHDTSKQGHCISPIRTERYANSFFSSTIKEWKNLSDEVKSKPSIQSFKQYLNGFKRPMGNSVFCTNVGLNSSRNFVLTFQMFGITGSSISDIIGSDVSLPPEEHFYSILVYGSWWTFI